MDKTLYLTESGNDICVRRDGPSVWITTRDKAGQRAPGRLLGRVIIMGNVRLDAASITHWAENGLPVLFMSSDGAETALTLPYNHRLPVHYKRQRRLFQTQNHIRRFLNWAYVRREVVCDSVANRLLKAMGKKPVNGIGLGNYERILAEFKPLNEDQWTVVAAIISNLFRTLITEKLLKAGLDPHLGAIHRRCNFGLTLDIEHIIGAEADIQAIQFFRSRAEAALLIKRKDSWVITPAGMKNIAHRFENRRKDLAELIDIIIDEIFDIMREAVR